MKPIASILLLTVLIFSCSKKDDAPTSPYDIKNIAGHYTGGSLSWEKTDNGIETSGADANGTFDIEYIGNNNAKVTVSTVAPVTNKVYEMSLFGKTETATSAGYIFQLLESSATLQKNIALRITMTTKTSAQIDYTHTQTAGGVSSSEIYAVNGFPGNE